MLSKYSKCGLHELNTNTYKHIYIYVYKNIENPLKKCISMVYVYMWGPHYGALIGAHVMGL